MSTERKKKSLKIADHLPRLALRAEVPSWGLRGAVSPPNFLTFLTAQRNSGASGEVNYRYLKFISCNFFLKLFYILLLN